MQWNARSLTTRHNYAKIAEFQKFLESFDKIPEILCIQETWNHKGQKELKIPGYTHAAAYGRPKGQQGGGVAICVRYGLDFSDLKLKNNNKNFEIAGIKLHGHKDNVAIVNFYKPKGNTYVSEREYLEIFGNINDNIIFLGDFNAHNRLWEPHCTMDDAPSKQIIKFMNTK